MKGRLQNPEFKARDCPGCGRTKRPQPQLLSLWPPSYPPPVNWMPAQEARQLSAHCGVYKVRAALWSAWKGHQGGNSPEPLEAQHPLPCWVLSVWVEGEGSGGAGKRALGNCIPGDLAGALQKLLTEPTGAQSLKLTLVHRGIPGPVRPSYEIAPLATDSPGSSGFWLLDFKQEAATGDRFFCLASVSCKPQSQPLDGTAAFTPLLRNHYSRRL